MPDFVPAPGLRALGIPCQRCGTQEAVTRTRPDDDPPNTALCQLCFQKTPAHSVMTGVTYIQSFAIMAALICWPFTLIYCVYRLIRKLMKYPPPKRDLFKLISGGNGRIEGFNA